MSATYTTAHCSAGSLTPLSEARNWTHILMDTNRVRYGWAMTGTPKSTYFLSLKVSSISASTQPLHSLHATSNLLFRVRALRELLPQALLKENICFLCLIFAELSEGLDESYRLLPTFYHQVTSSCLNRGFSHIVTYEVGQSGTQNHSRPLCIQVSAGNAAQLVGRTAHLSWKCHPLLFSTCVPWWGYLNPILLYSWAQNPHHFWFCSFRR